MVMHFLNDENAALFREIKEWWLQREVTEDVSPDPSRPATPDVFIAKPQSVDGIPAMTVDPDGLVPDRPGRALCDVARITYRAGNMEIHLLSGFREVYNYQATAVPQQWIVVARTKPGKWVAIWAAATEIQWGKAIIDSVDGTGTGTGTGGEDCPYVTINPCDDCLGTNPDAGTEINVLLPGRVGFTHRIAIGDVIAYSMAECGEYTCDSDYSCNVQWGKVTVGASGIGEAGNSPTVTVNPCDDVDGNDTDPGAAVNVYLPAREGVAYQVSVDDVIAYSTSESGERTCVSDYSIDIISWAKAQADWTGSTVSCKACDMDGNNVEGDAFTVYLPHNANGMSGDPCIFENAVIGYSWAPNAAGTLVRVCVTDYMDDKIGTVKMWIGILGNVPEGWRVLEALKGKFPVGAGVWVEGKWEHEYALGDTGGDDYHGYDSGETEHVNDHTDHADHTLHHHDAICAAQVDDGAETAVWLWDPNGSSTDGIDSNAGDADFKAHDEHTITDNRPEFYAVYMIERFE